jgi:hypothetical protein
LRKPVLTLFVFFFGGINSICYSCLSKTGYLMYVIYFKVILTPQNLEKQVFL